MNKENFIDGFKEIVTSPNGWMFLIFLMVVIFIFVRLSKIGLFSFNGKGFRIGSDEMELTIVRNQTQWAHLFVMSLKGKIIDENDNEITKILCENVLEKVYDKVIEWITLNHINASNSYLEIKQSEVKCLVYSLIISDEFKTPEFECRMNNWVKEIILNLINIRKEYSQQYKGVRNE